MPVRIVVVPRPTYKVEEEQVAISTTFIPGEEKTWFVVTGKQGQGSMSHLGDGSPELVTRIYTDGTLQATIRADTPARITAGWTASVAVRTYNPAATITATISTVHLVGWRF